MATMAGVTALLLALLVTMSALLLHTTPAGAVRASASTPQKNYTAFVRRSCSSTLYPSLCYKSLSSYATAVAQDPIQLARVAANVSLARVRSASFHVSSLCRAATLRRVDARTVSVLEDCEESLGDAADLTRQAAAELGLLATAEGPDVAWRVSNAQTWLSAALTNEDTCTDGFSAAATVSAAAAAGGGGGASWGSAVGADVCGRVRQAKEHTSNALALVNSLVGATNR